MEDLLKNYDKSRSKKAKLIALCIKAITATIGTSLILTENHPYLSIIVLGIGAVSDEVIKYYDDKIKEKEKADALAAAGAEAELIDENERLG